MTNRTMAVLGRRPMDSNESVTDFPGAKFKWFRVGIATVLPDGSALVRINAIPLNWDGNLKLVEDKEP